MRKSTWMAQLERALSREGMTGTEKRTVLNYYEEMYQDRLDEGATEESIIKEFGFPEDVAQSVRENDVKYAKDGDARYDRGVYQDADDIPVGTRVQQNYDVEAQGYFRQAPQYSAPVNVANAPVNTEPVKRKGSSIGVIRLLVYILLATALFSLGFGLVVGGIAVIVAAFAAIAFSAGVWLIAFGVGLVIFSVGCLIFGTAVKFVKSIFNSVEGGAR